MLLKNLNSLSSLEKYELFTCFLEYIESDHYPINGHGNYAHNHHGDQFLGWHSFLN